MKTYKFEGKSWIVPELREGEKVEYCNNIKCAGSFCMDCIFKSQDDARLAYFSYIKYGDLTKIETPFGLLPEEAQERLKEEDKNGSRIEWFDKDIFIWEVSLPTWCRHIIYRLSPQKSKREKIGEIVKENVTVHLAGWEEITDRIMKEMEK